MKKLTIRRTVCVLFVFVAACWEMRAAFAQETGENSLPAYRNTSLSIEQRAADLVHRMTLEEKASQLVNQARAIPRLNVPAYDWWSEALHGVAVDGSTEFPEPIGLAATFDVPGIHEMAVAISIEGRVKHAQDVRAGHSNMFEGLDFWAPNVNIFRDPRWGRGQETYGEDPFLTARMGVAFVTGMQGDDPHYYRTIATPKHYAVHSGPEPTRRSMNVQVSKHDELDTYLPAFRATVTEGKADSVMCAYNSINGQPACANEFLLEDQLRHKWGFQGYVVSDCGAVTSIFTGHHFTASQPEASALAVKRGMDNECAEFFTKVTDNRDYVSYLNAVKQGLLKESDIDVAVTRLMTARMKLGMFDPPEIVPYTKIGESELDSAAHRALARKLANESMVLLKNAGVLPLKPEVKRLALVGPLADRTRVLLGNYTGIPTHSVSVLEGLKAELPAAEMTFVPGTKFLRNEGSPVPAELLTTDGKPGVRAEYATGEPMAKPTPLVTRVENSIDLTAQALPPEAAGKSPLRVHWTATFTPQDTGDYQLGVEGSGFARITLDSKEVLVAWMFGKVQSRLGRVHLEKGKPHALEVDYGQLQGNLALRLIWTPYDLTPSPDAVAAARNADVVVAVVGITSDLEGEDMQVSEEGFKGGDRTSLDLPKPEEDLLKAMAATGKPLVVVLMNGSALGVNWAKGHANAILEAWYSGEEGGAAIAETLSGKNNPAGRLPVTFYRSINQLPNFENYSMEGRTYRYFQGKPLYPFGYGLSYATFSYSGLTLPRAAVKAGDPVRADVTVTNTGKVAGDEVAQLYLKFPPVKGAPLIALRGFQRIHLDPGASQKVHFELKNRDLGMVTKDGHPIMAGGDYTISIGGGLPDTGAPGVTGHFRVEGQIDLPE
jgi:beta-glucosidase